MIGRIDNQQVRNSFFERNLSELSIRKPLSKNNFSTFPKVNQKLILS